MAHAARAKIGQAFDIRDAIEEGADEIDLVGGDFFDGAILDPAYAFEQAGDTDCVVTAGLVFVGHEIRLPIVFGNGTGAAFDRRRQDFFDAGADIEKAGAEWSQKSLVAGS